MSNSASTAEADGGSGGSVVAFIKRAPGVLTAEGVAGRGCCAACGVGACERQPPSPCVANRRSRSSAIGARLCALIAADGDS